MPGESLLPPLCWRWEAVSSLDRMALCVAFALCYLLFHILAVLYATRWSKSLLLLSAEPIQTKFVPKEEHRHASFLYMYQHAAGGSILSFSTLAAALLATPTLLPPSYRIVNLVPSLSNALVLTVTVDCLMYLFHRAAHHPSLKQWSGHGEHHKMLSPTAQTAVMGSLRESLLLVWLCPLIGLSLWPTMTFSDAMLSLAIFELHLNSIHSEKEFLYDSLLHRIGLVTTKTHHVHHLRQTKNLGHVFLWWDILGGTYLSWEEQRKEQ